MAVVADTENDHLRLVRNLKGAAGTVSTVLKEKMVVKPRRIAMAMANPTDSNNAGVRKMYAFVACGRRTVVRIENVLGRKRTTPPEKKAYENMKSSKLDDCWIPDFSVLHVFKC